MTPHQALVELGRDRDPDWEPRALARVADLPEGPVRWLGEHLARNRECGPNFGHVRMVNRVSVFLVEGGDDDRIALLERYQPKLGRLIASAWIDAAVPFHPDWTRTVPSAVASSDLINRQDAFLESILELTAGFDREVSWHAARVRLFREARPTLVGEDGGPLARLLAAGIDAGGTEGEATFAILRDSALGRHEIGRPGLHVLKTFLMCSRPEAWEFVERKLLEADDEETRRSILAVTADRTAHPEALRRLYRLIIEENLLRFESVARGVEQRFRAEFLVLEESPATIERRIRALLATLPEPLERPRPLRRTPTHSQRFVEEEQDFLNCFGLIEPADRTWPEAPAPREVEIVTPAAIRLIEGVADFVRSRSYRDVPVGEHDPFLERLIFGVPYRVTDPEKAFAGILGEIRSWWESRDESMRDPDGLELVRARLLFVGDRAWRKHIPRSEGPNDRRPLAVQAFLRGLDLIDDPRGRVGLLVDVLLSGQVEWSVNRVLEHMNQTVGNALRNATPDELGRLWRLLRWNDDGRRGLAALRTAPKLDMHAGRRIPSLDVVVACRKAGAATDADVIDALIGYGCGDCHNLRLLSSRKNRLFSEEPWLDEIFQRCCERLLDVELARGYLQTPVTRVLLKLRSIRGIGILVRLLSALGEKGFSRPKPVRNWAGERVDSGSETSPREVLLYLVARCVPRPGETVEEFAAAMDSLNASEDRLIELAMLAPQWAPFVGRKLGWPMFEEAIWWLRAHTKSPDWIPFDEFHEERRGEIGRRTPLTLEELTEGAVDVAWFERIRAEMDDSRWKKVEATARYASSDFGFARAQTFARALMGRTDPAALMKRIREKRPQDGVRALGLIPLKKGRDGGEVLERYEAIQEFLRTGKKFGAARRSNEKLAAEIGLANLARTAGYADPMRLQWAMEASALTDLAAGSISHVEGNVTVTLRIDDLGRAALQVEKSGKRLKNVPAAIAKVEGVKALTDRMKALKTQEPRMRSSLEEAMVRGDVLTGAEVRELAAHAMLARMLAGTVLVGADDPSAMGYPVEGGAELEIVAPTPARRPIGGDERFRVAHPYDLLISGTWHQWQRDAFDRERVQPFKQIFRELYPVVEGERECEQSLRYEGHEVEPRRALALLGGRLWIQGFDSDDIEEEARRAFHSDGVVAVLVSAIRGIADENDRVIPDGMQLRRVRFETREGRDLLLKDVPPRVFSEAMRDIDLVASVAHAGGEPEASSETIATRSALVAETLAALKIGNARLEKNHAIIEGTRANYSVHLGSGGVHILPGGYQCIVPVGEAARSRVFLPFADDDPKTAEVISKVLLLARDGEIKDKTILEQIRRPLPGGS